MIKALSLKLKEALISVAPVAAIVLIISFTPLVDLSPVETGAFAVCSVLLVLGIGLFNLGADLAMTPMGEHVGARVYGFYDKLESFPRKRSRNRRLADKVISRIPVQERRKARLSVNCAQKLERAYYGNRSEHCVEPERTPAARDRTLRHAPFKHYHNEQNRNIYDAR